MGGHVHSGFLALPIVAPYLKNGRLRALAVTTLKRSSAIPQVPTLDESGLRGFDVSQWWGILAPAGTSPQVIKKLSSEIAVIVMSPDIKKLMAGAGAEPAASDPEQFRSYIKAEIAKFKRIVNEAKITID
jgi:tripartite-type tricarboxylate transporter receptor subunit TctC